MLSVLVPCFDEAAGLAALESELFSELASLGRPFEVLAVDDGSADMTGAGLREMAARRPELRVLSHERNRGIGAAIRTSLDAARGEWLVAVDADLTFHPRHIRALLEAQPGPDADCVAGSPFLSELSAVPLRRRLPSVLVNAAYRALFGASLTAYTPMFRLYRVSALRACGFQSEGFEASAEIAVLFLKAGRRIVEVPVPLTTRRTGRSKLRSLRELWRHLRLIRRLLCS